MYIKNLVFLLLGTTMGAFSLNGMLETPRFTKTVYPEEGPYCSITFSRYRNRIIYSGVAYGLEFACTLDLRQKQYLCQTGDFTRTYGYDEGTRKAYFEELKRIYNETPKE